jgi:natural product precursor
VKNIFARGWIFRIKIKKNHSQILKYIKMKSLKLNKINSNQLNEEQMKEINGGCFHHCTCGCAGSSSSNDNGNANYYGGKHSPGGGEKLYWC